MKTESQIKKRMQECAEAASFPQNLKAERAKAWRDDLELVLNDE